MAVEKSECLFCNIANGKDHAYVIYQNNHISCFLDIDPISEGHVLIVPKQHLIEIDTFDMLTTNNLMAAAILVTKAIKRLYAPDGVSMMQNGGSFNDANHYHLHVFPRYKKDGFSWTYPKNIETTPESQTRRAEYLQNTIAEMNK